MITRFLNYQRLLNLSINSFNNKQHPRVPFLNHMLFFIFMYSFIFTLDGSGTVFFPIIFTLSIVYQIINSQNKLFEIVPVSKLYSCLNIYLFVLVVILVFITTFVLLGLFSLLFNNIMHMHFVINFNLDGSNVILSFRDWKSTLIPGCISIIVASILLPMFFIKNKVLRKSLTLSSVALATISLISFRNTLPVVPVLGKINFLKSIIILPHYNKILLILTCICMVILPISISISYKIYKGKRCLVC